MCASASTFQSILTRLSQKLCYHVSWCILSLFCDSNIFDRIMALCFCFFKYSPQLFQLQNAIQLAYGTSVVLLRCPVVPEIIHRVEPEVFLHSKAGKSPYHLDSVGATLNPIKKNHKTIHYFAIFQSVRYNFIN